ncbi:MAG: RNA polymerase sigma factor [Candidatus Moranbacteria bacterium]|nr:RNA polymerase sigma factor [Candidatus Moranbacteria bacterium]
MTKRKYSKEVGKDVTDEELVALVRRVDPGYYEAIVTRYRKKLLPYFWRLIGVGDEAEDLLQNVFIKVFEHLADFDIQRKFSPWIYRIAHNEAVNYLKKKSYRQLIAWEDITSVKEMTSARDEGETPEEARMRDEARIALRRALNTLPKKYREILQLRYYLDKSYAEMSRILKKPENTVASMLSRAKKQLFKSLGERNRDVTSPFDPERFFL